jgi:hypothetical protein
MSTQCSILACRKNVCPKQAVTCTEEETNWLQVRGKGESEKCESEMAAFAANRRLRGEENDGNATHEFDYF